LVPLKELGVFLSPKLIGQMMATLSVREFAAVGCGDLTVASPTISLAVVWIWFRHSATALPLALMSAMSGRQAQQHNSRIDLAIGRVFRLLCLSGDEG
jgi:hypothetical protein